MKICHISLFPINKANPLVWLNLVPYYTKVLERQAEEDDVHSVHYFSGQYSCVKLKGVTYHFYEFSICERLHPTHLIKFLNAHRADVVILHGFHASVRAFFLLGAIRGTRFFCQHHGERIFKFPKSLVHRINDSFIRGYLFSSIDLGRDWVKHKQIGNKNKLFEVMEVTSSFESHTEVIIRKKPLSFLWVGRLKKVKDPLTLVEGFIDFSKDYHRASLNIIFSDDELLPLLKGRAAELPANINLVGNVEHDQMPFWYQQSDFIVSTSLYEGSGIAILEAMSFGCIPILANIPAFQTMTQHGQLGVLFERGSVKALSKALKNALELDVENERAKVLAQYRTHLSAKAIAVKIKHIFNSTV